MGLLAPLLAVLAAALPGVAPAIVAGGAGDVSDTRASVGVVVAPSALPVSVTVEYGPTEAYGSTTPAERVGPSAEVTPVYVRLKGLEPGTTYHFRFRLTGDAGETIGPDMTLTTTGAAAPAPPAGEEPAIQHLFVAAEKHTGKVKVKAPGSKAFGRLTERISLGSVLDARKGSVALTSALPDGGSQTATFRGGMFEVRQDAADGRTDVYLRGGSFAACRSDRATASRRKRRKRRRVRSLWSSDTSGLYSTHGENSVATVRGTRWLTVDRCDGTLTRVKRGAVEVRDLETGRTTLVRAGHSHLAPR